jgi:hypothetical protein
MPEMMQPQGQPQQQPEAAEGGGGDFGALLESTFKGLLDIRSTISQGNVPPAAQQQVEAAIQALQSAVQAISGGEGAAEGEPAEAEPVQMNDAMAGGKGTMRQQY